MKNWNSITSHEAVETIVKQSYNKPQIIFKHSVRCGISSHAQHRIEAGLDLGCSENRTQLNRSSNRFFDIPVEPRLAAGLYFEPFVFHKEALSVNSKRVIRIRIPINANISPLDVTGLPLSFRFSEVR